MKLELEGVSFSYSHGHREVLHDVSLAIDEPGLYCIVGPNGAGKSTLIKCLNKLAVPSSGKVLLDGKDVFEMSFREISEIVAYVPVSTNDLFSMPVVSAVLMGRRKGGRWRTSDEDLAKVSKALSVMGIEDLADRRFNELSAGQHQKVAIARGLVQEPDILILDEPTANLDVKHQVYMAEFLRAVSIAKGIIVIMVCHDLNIASKYSHRVIVMDDGRIVRTGTSEEVMTEDFISSLYGVECRIVEDSGRPHIILGSPLNI